MENNKRKNLWICKNCLRAIESREGKQVVIEHDMEFEEEETNSKCDWCEDDFNVLYELI